MVEVVVYTLNLPSPPAVLGLVCSAVGGTLVLCEVRCEHWPSCSSVSGLGSWCTGVAVLDSAICMWQLGTKMMDIGSLLRCGYYALTVFRV